MNTPGTTEGNWHWRFDWQQVESGLARKICETLTAGKRCPAKPEPAEAGQQDGGTRPA